VLERVQGGAREEQNSFDVESEENGYAATGEVMAESPVTLDVDLEKVELRVSVRKVDELELAVFPLCRSGRKRLLRLGREAAGKTRTSPRQLKTTSFNVKLSRLGKTIDVDAETRTLMRVSEPKPVRRGCEIDGKYEE
jgi:protein tyrosine phosphatase (PTP) superfamily phosphohydrolase (DUF442 family)